MILAWMEFGAGLLVVLLTLSDIFSSIMIPGPNKGLLKIAARVRIVSLPFWRYLSRTRGHGRRQRLSNGFAPLAKVRSDYAGRLASPSRHLGAEQTLLFPK